MIPTISGFTSVLAQCAFYEQYRFKYVKYTIMPLQNVNTTSNSLIYVYDVPVYSNELPAATVVSFSTYDDLKIDLVDRQLPPRVFKPYSFTNSSA